MSSVTDPTLHISTNDLCQKDPVAALEGSLASSVLSLHIEPAPGRRFSALMSGAIVGSAVSCHWSMSPGRTERNRRELQTGSAFYSLVMLRNHGAAVIRRLRQQRYHSSIVWWRSNDAPCAHLAGLKCLSTRRGSAGFGARPHSRRNPWTLLFQRLFLSLPLWPPGSSPEGSRLSTQTCRSLRSTPASISASRRWRFKR